jgi:rfaE bifunctional protein nucleotidyltransferase chain/domain
MEKAPYLENPKLHSLEESIVIRETARKEGKVFVLTNGCFDLLHPGHLSYLREAKSRGDILWIALNGEKSVQKLKGPTRPVMSDQERAYMLAGFEAIDGIVVFETERLDKEILALRPDVYVKAGDYTIETLNIQERKALELVGARIEFLPFLKGYSTTGLIEKISKAAGTF